MIMSTNLHKMGVERKDGEVRIIENGSIFADVDFSGDNKLLFGKELTKPQDTNIYRK